MKIWSFLVQKKARGQNLQCLVSSVKWFLNIVNNKIPGWSPWSDHSPPNVSYYVSGELYDPQEKKPLQTDMVSRSRYFCYSAKGTSIN